MPRGETEHGLRIGMVCVPSNPNARQIAMRVVAVREDGFVGLLHPEFSPWWAERGRPLDALVWSPAWQQRPVEEAPKSEPGSTPSPREAAELTYDGVMPDAVRASLRRTA